jgi:hypothetical protein
MHGCSWVWVAAHVAEGLLIRQINKRAGSTPPAHMPSPTCAPPFGTWRWLHHHAPKARRPVENMAADLSLFSRDWSLSRWRTGAERTMCDGDRAVAHKLVSAVHQPLCLTALRQHCWRKPFPLTWRKESSLSMAFVRSLSNMCPYQP